MGSRVPEHLHGLCQGTIKLRDQVGTPTRCPNRSPADGEIDWSWPAARVHDFIRAQAHPYPGAFTYFNDEKVVIERADENPDGSGVLVRCGDGRKLRLHLRGHQAGSIEIPASALALVATISSRKSSWLSPGAMLTHPASVNIG